METDTKVVAEEKPQPTEETTNDKTVKATSVSTPDKTAPKAGDSAKEKRKKSKLHEILRFIIIGILCTIIDFAIQYCLTKFVFAKIIPEQATWGGYVSYGIAVTLAFIVANIVNFGFSRLYVFQNVDKNINTKTQKAWWTYFGLGAGGWLIGVALQELGFWICNAAWKLNLSLDITKISLLDALKNFDAATWAFIIVFCLKTCVTMVYNYETRKHLIFKAPKEDAPAEEEKAPAEKPSENKVVIETKTSESKPLAQEEAKPSPASQEKKEDQLATSASVRKIFQEEVEKVLGPAPLCQSEDDTRKMVREEIDSYDKEHAEKK